MKSLSPTVQLGGPEGGDAGRGGPIDYAGRLQRARLGLAVAVTPIALLFLGLTTAYLIRQSSATLDLRTGNYAQHWPPVHLPLRLLLVNSALLLASSLALEFARRQRAHRVALAAAASVPGVSLGKEPAFPWLAVSIALGLSFLGGQWRAWQELERLGFYVGTSPGSSFVYALTVAHAIHVSAGLAALLYAAALSHVRNRPLEARYIVLEISAWYWHYMAAAHRRHKPSPVRIASEHGNFCNVLSALFTYVFHMATM